MIEKVSDAFVNSQKVNPNDFLTDGENPCQAKMRIASVVAVVIQSGLNMRDGELRFSPTEQDMKDTQVALKLLKDDDTNFMRHSNDSLVNAMGAFVCVYQAHLMPMEKNMYSVDQVKKLAKTRLNTLKACLDNMHERGFDETIKPAVRNSQIGGRPSGVSAQVSMAMRRTL